MELYRNRSSSRSGVTVIESVIALLMITIMVGVLLTSQGRSLRVGVSTMLEQSVIQALQRRFVEIDKNKLDARKKTITSELQPPLPRGTIEYASRKPTSESALHKFPNLSVETLTARWNDYGREITTRLVRFHTHDEEVRDARA